MRAVRLRRPHTWWLLLAARVAAVVAVSAAAPARIAAQVQDECDLAELRRLPASQIGADWQARHPDTAYARMGERMGANDWLFLADSVILEFDAAAAAADPARRASFRAELDSLRRELAAALSHPDAEARRARARGVRLTRFQITLDPSRDSVFLFRGTANEIVVEPAMTLEARRAICWPALALSRMLGAYGAPARLDARLTLERAVRAWDAYGEKGYSQFPWELALNSALFDATSIWPPRTQLILLHPAASLELVRTDGGGLDDLHRVNTITVEPIGWIAYGTGYDWYVGLSALVSLPGEGLPVGAGALLHLGQMGKLGYVVRGRGDAPRRRDGVVISLDLYQLLTSTPERLREARDAALSRIPPAPIPR